MFQRIFFIICALLFMPLYAQVPQGTDLSQLNKGNAEANYRKRVFHAYKPLGELWPQLKLGSYSSYENPTGIYCEKGESLTVNLETQPSGSVQLIIHNFCEDGGHSNYPLQQGENKITAKNRGLLYVDYRSSEGCKATPITVSLKGGKINGVFSRHDDNATWKKLLSKASAGTLDMMGERCQVSYHVEGLREGAKDQGAEMLALYDYIVELQQKFMGWDSQGIHPGNHIMCRVIWQGFMHADGEGAAFHKDTIAGISNPESLRKNAWGVAHELGHVNQVRPHFCWAGMTEVTNNLFSQLTAYKLNPKDIRCEHEESPAADGQWMRGADFDRYINRGVVAHRTWQFQSSNSNCSDNAAPSEKDGGDPLVTLCPLWQLYLYCHEVLGKEDFYPNVFRRMREQPDNITQGQMRVNLCRFACEAAELDLTSFLLHSGMLGIMNRYVGDYSSHMVTVTEDMVAPVIREAARFPEPETPVIFYITANSVDIYRKRLDVVPSRTFRAAVSKEGCNIVVPADEWKNAVAFEVYAGKELVRVCLRGLGHKDDATTTVICPPGTTAVRAVQWDGKRYNLAMSRKGGDDKDDKKDAKKRGKRGAAR